MNFSKKKSERAKGKNCQHPGWIRYEGTVESLQTYGAFVSLEDGLSGLVHISRSPETVSQFPKAVLNVGDQVKVKVIGIKDGKISLSMKALEEAIQEEEVVEKVEIPKAKISEPALGDLFKNIKLIKLNGCIYLQN